MITASNVTMQFGAKPLFENVSVKFGDGNRYGLIGANGSRQVDVHEDPRRRARADAGNVSIEPHERLGKLRQDQFAFEESACSTW